MEERRGGYRFEYHAPVLRGGRGCVAGLADELRRRGLDDGFVVTGRNVGADETVMSAVKQGLGDRFAGVYAETTPAKSIDTAAEAAAEFDDVDADCFVGVGGGSSLDVAKTAAVLTVDGTTPEQVAREVVETGGVTVADGELPELFAVPTTLAGADVSDAAGVTVTEESAFVESGGDGGFSHPELMPEAVFHDAALFEVTPSRVLAASAFNGFDKAVETLYAPAATPVTDAAASRGLRLMHDGLLALYGGGDHGDGFDRVAEAVPLVQYGVAQTGVSTLSVIHAFGHGLTRSYGVQQGVAHAVVAPEVLRFVFDRVDGRRRLLAEALEVDLGDGGSGGDAADEVVAAVERLRETLALPRRLSRVDGPERNELTRVAGDVVDDPLMEYAPPGLDVGVDDVVGVLERCW